MVRLDASIRYMCIGFFGGPSGTLHVEELSSACACRSIFARYHPKLARSASLVLTNEPTINDPELCIDVAYQGYSPTSRDVQIDFRTPLNLLPANNALSPSLRQPLLIWPL